MQLIWYKQSGFRLAERERIIYIDPWVVPEGEPPADFIFLTHAHFDHFDLPTIGRLRMPHTVVIAPPDVAQQLSGEHVIAVGPNEQRTIDHLQFQTVPAYNLKKHFHPKENNWVGYILTTNGERIYHAGDTDAIPEMNDISCDIALLPIGGTYTMNVPEAVKAAKILKAPRIIPMHFGFIVGSRKDGAKLAALLPGKVDELKPQLPFER